MSTDTIKIYNSFTRHKDVFTVQNAGRVKMYVCGVTVYDDCHIGHARSLYIFEVIRRYLSYRGYKVDFVRNITDIDDKIIKRAKELNIGWKQLVDKYIESYYQDLNSLNIEKADYEPRATENVDGMIEYVSVLIKKGYAYVLDSGVYFSVRKSNDYGKLSGQNVDDMISGARVEAIEEKRDSLDFALWKISKEDEPGWDSPWGRGRPGWHIECSVMSQKYLKTGTLDIHGGGRDLIFPHHENERAQSEALTGKVFSNYWMHHGLLTIEGQKMAKSLGNCFTIKDILNKYSADILKIFYLHAHYSSPIDFSWNKMEEAKKAYERISILMFKLKSMLNLLDVDKRTDKDKEDSFRRKFIESMDDDFNMSKGLGSFFDLVNICNKLLTSDSSSNRDDLHFAYKVLNEIAGVFALTFEQRQAAMISSGEIEEKINFRIRYKKEKKFKEADAIREELSKKGIILEDTRDGTEWRKKI